MKNKESKSESFIPLEVQCNILLHPRVRRSLSLFTGFTSRGVCWPPLLFAIVSFCGRLGWFVLPTWRLFSTPSVGMEGKCRSLLGRPPPMLSFGPWRVVMEHPHSTAPPPLPVTLSHGCTQLCNLSILLRVAACIVDVVGCFRTCRALCCRLTRLDIGFRSFCCT